MGQIERKEATEVTWDKRIKKRKGHIKNNVRTGWLRKEIKVT